jgi:hypothetical protein
MEPKGPSTILTRPPPKALYLSPEHYYPPANRDIDEDWIPLLDHLALRETQRDFAKPSSKIQDEMQDEIERKTFKVYAMGWVWSGGSLTAALDPDPDADDDELNDFLHGLGY